MASSARGASRIYQLLLITIAVWAGVYARVALGPLQETMRGALGLTDHQVALLQGPAIALSVMIGAIPVGLLIDRYPRVRLLIGFVVLELLGSAVTVVAPNFVVLFAARSLVGLSAIASLIAAFSLIADLYGPSQRGRGTMVVAGGADFAQPAAFAFGGVLLVTYGVSGDGWRWALLWMTVPPLALATLLTLGLREPPRTGLVIKNPPVRAAFSELWRYRAMVVPLLAARCMVWVADGATVIWAAPFLQRRFDLPPDRVGTIMATVMLVAGLPATISAGLLADLCHRAGGPRRTMQALGAVALLSLPASLFGLTTDVLWASVMLAAFITLGFIANITGAALSTIVIPNEIRGTYLSLSMVVGSFFGVALAPMLVSVLSDSLGGPQMVGKALATICVISSALGTATFMFGSRYFPRASTQ